MKLDREVDEMKRLLTGYLRKHRVGMVLFPVFAVIYTAVLSLFRIPAAVNLYALALCAAAGLAATAWDFSVYVRRHRILLHMEKEVTDTLQHLPLPKDLLEEDYQNIIRAAFQNDREKAFQADRKYTDMLDYFTMWAHQIKTPISALKLLIQSGEMDEETRGSLLDQLFRIEQYVEMVLCYVRLSGQVSDYIIAEYDLDDIIRQAVRKYAPVFIRSRCRLVYEPLNRTVLTDEKWLVFVIEQILSNSLKYTEAAGKPDPYVEICMEGDSVLVIRDNGIGIAAEDLPRIFEKGYTGCNGRTDKKSTGLGLYLCSRICRNLGHGIEAVSEAGEGTEIRLDLSRYDMGTEKPAHLSAPALSK
ncbi:MAG: sensor histidine kinase [Firmicutes bacterium]|nr:sensor histidine kinase [Bacillota bacterium]